MYRLYNFHLLNDSRPSYNVKIPPEKVAPVQPMLKQATNGGKPVLMTRNFLSIITNASGGKGCSSCGGR
jgi:hypothetical protein